MNQKKAKRRGTRKQRKKANLEGYTNISTET